jgi:hypothetical protein
MKCFFILLICLGVSGCAHRIYTKEGLTSQQFVKDVEECGRQPQREFGACMKAKGYIKK